MLNKKPDFSLLLMSALLVLWANLHLTHFSPFSSNCNKSVLPFLMDFTKKDFCSVFVIINSHCCCCPQKDCVNEVGKNF